MIEDHIIQIKKQVRVIETELDVLKHYIYLLEDHLITERDNQSAEYWRSLCLRGEHET